MKAATPGARLEEVLAEAQRRRLLGTTPVDQQIAHALSFADALDDPPERVVDLGSGGGLPGLVLGLLAWPAAQLVLVDAQQRRATFLAWAVGHLGCAERIEVRHARAEDLGRQQQVRHSFDLVVARSFASPAVTAECAAPLLAVGGRLVVSEPPEPAPARWPAEPLAELGLEVDRLHTDPPRRIALVQRAACPVRFPRRAGIPGKRPLWRVE